MSIPIIYGKIGAMVKPAKNVFGKIWSSLFDLPFKSLYFLIRFLILIGEITKKSSILPFILIGKATRKIIKKSVNVLFSKEAVNKKISEIKIYKKKNEWRIKAALFYAKIRLTLKQVKILRVKLPKIKIALPRINFKKLLKIRLPSFRFVPIKIRYFFLGCILTVIITFVYQSYLFVKALPSPNNIGKINYPLSTHILDRNGKLLYEIYRDQNRTPVDLDKLSPYVYQATIAIEDKDFYKHKGVSVVSGIFRAIKDMIFKGNLQGGSTITQQLVKSALLTPERTIKRKIKEIILALWTEQLFNKNQILQMYLNQVAYGGSSYGIEEAAKTFFGKSAKNLTLSEAALLAGLPQAPSTYSPYLNPDIAKWRRNDVLDKMMQLHYISQDEKKKAQNEELSVTPLTTQIHAPHFVFYVRSFLEDRYGIRSVEEGGLNVTSTLDLEIQNEAEKILREEIEKIKGLNVTNGAILVTRPQTGEILAMVGSVDYFTNPSGAFNVTTAQRQPGSSIKPLMYSLALQKGYTASSIIDDSPISFHAAGSSEVYSPVNYDGRFHGKIPLRYALANSYNVPAVKVLNTLGVRNFVDHATRMGISTWGDPSRFGLSLTLGGGEVKVIDMAEAFGVFANEGYRVNVTGIAKLEDTGGKAIYNLRPLKYKVLNEGISYIISDILADNFARQFAFGAHSSLEIPGYKVAVKTGTTNDKKDNWTIGYTPDFLVAVWVGNNDGTPMNPVLTSGITGASPIWNRTMSYLLKNYSDSSHWFKKPEDIVEKSCYYGRSEYFLAGTEKSAYCLQADLNQTPTPTPH